MKRRDRIMIIVYWCIYIQVDDTELNSTKDSFTVYKPSSMRVIGVSIPTEYQKRRRNHHQQKIHKRIHPVIKAN